ncbi:MAG: hypothetical protein PHQ58_09695 [Rhodoferax sp.]|uniref:hypothetical protein n=1 Tax=Rhodoferax sp. TaxID=50421 RepID=UPI002608D459|nr:hypothetical protein [Rhodoferax sp.]MDD2880701.1 hypothetical protein [Rhodoferax sp.]
MFSANPPATVSAIAHALPSPMIFLIFFLAGVTLMLSLFPDGAMAVSLLVPLGLVALVRLILFLTADKKK